MKKRVPSERQKVAELKRLGRDDGYINSYLRGWRQPASQSNNKTRAQ